MSILNSSVFLAVHYGERFRLNEIHPQLKPLANQYPIELYGHFPGGGDDFPLFFILKNRDYIVSRLRAIPDLVTVDGRQHRWAWTADNFTCPEYRRQGLSTELQRRATDYLHQRGIGRGSVFSTDSTLRIFQKLGIRFVGYAKRALLARSPEPLIRGHLNRETVRWLASTSTRPLVGLLMAFLRRWNRTKKAGTSRVPAESLSDDDLQAFLDQTTGRRRVHFSTDLDLLKRKIRMIKDRNPVAVWIIRDDSNGKILSYMSVRSRIQERPMAGRYRDFRLMSLMDFAFADDEPRAATALVGHLLDLFFQSKADVLEVISNHDLLNQVVTQSGFLHLGKGMSFSYSVPRAWPWADGLMDLSCWPLTQFCGDGFTL